MRRPSLPSDRGATAVLIAILLVVLLGMLSLAVDGGALFLKHRRMRTANDAAALAAALSCARKEGTTAADIQAASLATANVTDAVAVEPPAYDPACDADAGTVTVHFRSTQPLFFSQVVGVDSPKPVGATATAAWGGAGSAAQVVPLMLSLHRLSIGCDIPDGAIEGDRCFFWWDNGTPNDTTALTNAEWGLMDLRTWGVDRYGSCAGNVNQSLVTEWVTNGYPGMLTLLEQPPTYVCRGSGFQGNALNNDVNSISGQIVPFPVNDPQQQVGPDGSLCRPDGVDGSCTVQKYAIVGYAMLEIVQVWTGQDAQLMCDHPSQSNGSLRCLEAVWRGYHTGGSLSGGGQNLGFVAIALIE
jgi:hypothetical protein